MNTGVRFPPKKFFNAQTPEFIKKRSQELESYLNEVASEESKVFRAFVGQIKKAALNA